MVNFDLSNIENFYFIYTYCTVPSLNLFGCVFNNVTTYTVTEESMLHRERMTKDTKKLDKACLYNKNEYCKD